MIDEANHRMIAAWQAESDRRQAEYEQTRKDIETSNRGMVDVWEALTAARKAEHDRACARIDKVNRGLIARWEAANAPWIAEASRWEDRLVSAEAEIKRLEDRLVSQRYDIVAKFRQRKDDAGGVIASYNTARQDYERELRQAEIDSKRIQLEEHLDKSLIRDQKIKGISPKIILALESFGIETAKDVALFNNQKVPGIGQVLSMRLFEWRDNLAASFVPSATMPESERNRVAGRYSPVMLPLGQSMEGAIRELEAIAAAHRMREGELLHLIGAAAKNAAIAAAHVQAMKVG